MRTRYGRVLAGLYIGLVLAFLFLPASVIIAFSFNSNPRLSFPLEGPSLEWYRAAFDNQFFADAFRNSILAALATALVAGALGTAAAFGLAHLRGRLRLPLTWTLLMPAVVPALLLGIALIVLLDLLDIAPGIRTIVIGHTLVALPFVVLTVSARVDRLDPAHIEAARDLGASSTRAFVDVTVPLVRAAVVGSLLIAAALSLDEFVITFFVHGTEDTLPVLIWALMRRGVDPTVNAIAAMILVGTIVLSLLAGRFAGVRV